MDRGAFFSELQALVSDEAQGCDAGQLVQRGLRLLADVRGQAFASDVPEDVWHYLSDFDIRAKDPGYRDDQISWVREVLGAEASRAG
ncbi:hypothetical protein [Sphingomonas montanisoli]|uniref:Uncharacterized protein n=1 Tax=Sphingomonas montanisoli TaxID=2606412 RepID=A0A5D9C613_9SPHN|nr:hypothetical protein [Sphingomonas montanisoli]TZG27244.1 hypothetical protein FYJ91_06370 [Sphingomonas montanisoli]